MASAGPDPLLIFLFSAFLVALTAVVLEESKRAAVLVGLIVVLGWLTKARFLIALPLLALAGLAMALDYLTKSPVYRANRQKFWLAGAGVLVALWLNLPRALGFIGLAANRAGPAAGVFDRAVLGVWSQPSFRFRMFRQFWGFFGRHGGVYLNDLIYMALYAAAALAVVGLALRLWRAARTLVAPAGAGGLALNFKPIGPQAYRRASAIALPVLALALAVLATGAYELSGSSALGRYLLIAALPAGLLLAAGLEALIPPKFRVFGLSALAGAGFWLNIVSITAFLMPRYY